MEQDFMNFSINGYAYLYLSCNATSFKGTNEKPFLYFTLQNYKNIYRPHIAEVLGKNNQTIDNYLKKFVKNGLLKEGRINDHPAYVFPEGKANNRYKLVDLDILEDILKLQQPIAPKVYVYLLNKGQYNKHYNFSLQELNAAMGYSPNSRDKNNEIKEALTSLASLGLLKYKKHTFYNEEGNPVNKLELEYIR